MLCCLVRAGPGADDDAAAAAVRRLAAARRRWHLPAWSLRLRAWGAHPDADTDAAVSAGGAQAGPLVWVVAGDITQCVPGDPPQSPL